MIDIQALHKQCQPYSILFVEDYEPLRQKLMDIFEIYFSHAMVAIDGEDGVQKYQEYMQTNNKPFDIVLTDIRMPKKDGIELTKEIKAITPDQLIIVLSAHKESDQLIEFINLGIAHYLCKPVEPNELYGVMQSSVNTLHIQNSEQKKEPSDTIVLTSHISWDKRSKTLYRDHQEVKLTPYELVALELMVEKLNLVCTMDNFVNYFYSKNYDLDTKSIRNVIFKLRKKLPNLLINNLYGVGYKLEGNYK